ncbi:hypothetical protein [Streptomyces sp. CC224B]|nr:hypothetical protein [Streptomyces sp. CC224B]
MGSAAAAWTFLTDRTRVLLMLARDPSVPPWRVAGACTDGHAADTPLPAG